MSYLKILPFSDLEATATLIRNNMVSNENALVFRGFPVNDDAVLLELTQMLGHTSSEGIDTPTNQRARDVIHLVKDHGKQVFDPFGNQITSTTSKHFGFHTDEYFAQHPSRVVFLACVKQATTGGESIIVSLDRILEHLPKDVMETLKTTKFPCHAGPKYLIEDGEHGPTLRYNRLEIDRANEMEADQTLTTAQLNALSHLEAIATREQESFMLKEGDFFAVNNNRSLHGRTEFPAGDVRILKRIRTK